MEAMQINKWCCSSLRKFLKMENKMKTMPHFVIISKNISTENENRKQAKCTLDFHLVNSFYSMIDIF